MADMHEQILAGALEVFSERGYSAATVKDISQRANCNSVTVYRHFTDKRSLFLQVVERYHALEVDEEALQSRLSYLNVRADLAVMAAYFFELIFRHIHILRIFISDGAGLGELGKYQWYLPAPCIDFVRDYLGAVYLHAIPAADAALMAELFVSYITRTCLRVSVHDGATVQTRTLAREAQAVMEPSIDLILALCKRYAGGQSEDGAVNIRAK